MMFRLLLLLCLGHCLPAVSGKKCISCDAGNNVILPCNGSTVMDINNIMWLFGSDVFGYVENGIWKAGGRYKLGSLEERDFSLVINAVEENDEGTYTCRNDFEDIQTSFLIVKGGRKRRDTEMSPGDRVCKPYRVREDPPGSITKDEQISDENPRGSITKDEQISGENPPKKHWMVTGVIMGMVGMVVTMAVALVLLKRNRQGSKELSEQSHENLLNGTSVHVDESSADKKKEEPDL